MFAPMVSALKNGTLPENSLLRKRFDAAIIKKMGVIQTPRAFWSADAKINPPAKQLLWAAILLHDKENFRIVEAIISKELEEKQRASGKPDSIKALAARVQLYLQAYLREFIELAPTEPFKSTLKKKVQALDLL